MRLYLVLTIASLKMYFRNRQAIFWALFFPLIFMIILGLMNFDRYSPPDVGLVDLADNEASTAFAAAVAADKDPLFDLARGTEEELRDDLKQGDIDALVVLPAGFGDAGAPADVQVIYDSRKPQEQAVVATVVEKTLDSVFLGIESVPDQYRVESLFHVVATDIEGENKGFKGFLVPGIAAMAIMQSGLFGVVFSLIRYKSGGILRRLQATPVGASQFLAGQITTRLVVSVLQTYVLILTGMLVLGVSVGHGTVMDWVNLSVLALLGGILFNTMGMAISGWAKTEDIAAPVANILSLPMMFLSGVFLPLDLLPSWLSNVSKYLPLTYLADGMRAITVNGASITTLGPELLGLAVWSVVAFVIAIRLFRWE